MSKTVQSTGFSLAQVVAGPAVATVVLGESDNWGGAMKAHRFSALGTFVTLLAGVIAGAAVATAANADTLLYDTALAPGFYNGSGNENVGFTTYTTDDGIELGLGTNLRFLSAIHPTPSNSNIYYVPLGISSGTASKWDILFSVNYSPNFTLGSNYWWLTVTNANNGQSIQFNPSLILDNASNGHGFQNAENLGFAIFAALFPTFDFDPNAVDQYLVTLSLRNSSDLDLISVSEVINATPLPATLPLFVGGLGVISFAARRRKRRRAKDAIAA